MYYIVYGQQDIDEFENEIENEIENKAKQSRDKFFTNLNKK